MLTLSDKTEPFVATSVAEIVSQITTHVGKGYFHYSVLRSPDGSAAFDLEVVQEIEKIKWVAHGVGVKPLVKYFRIGLSCLLLSTEASFFGPESRHGDIRETPLDFDGYRINCKKAGAKDIFETNLSISPDLIGMHSMTLTRPIHSVETVGRVLRKLLDVRSPEIIDQVETIFRAINVKRKAAGVELVSRGSAGLPEALVLPMASI